MQGGCAKTRLAFLPDVYSSWPRPAGSRHYLMQFLFGLIEVLYRWHVEDLSDRFQFGNLCCLLDSGLYKRGG